MSKTSWGIIESIAAYINQNPVRMHMPGHKGVGGHLGAEHCSVSQISAKLREMLDAIKILDVTEVRGLDNLHYAKGSIQTTQNALAQAFGAASTHCLVNGATCGILASLMAIRMTLGRGQVIVPRNVHRSIISGLVLSGLEPCFVYPEYDSRFGGYLPLTASDIEAQLEKCCDLKQLRADALEEVKGIVLVNPTYFGVCRDITDICHFAKDIGCAVVVDEAHGTLFSFSDDFPPSAIETKASLVVHGAHKTSQAFTQAGLLHVTEACLGIPGLASNVEEALRLVQSTSPSYILLASLEKALDDFHVDSLWVKKVRQLGQALADKLSHIEGLDIRIPKQSKGWFWDPGKVLVGVSGLGISGPQAQALLWEKGKIVPEMVGPDYVLLMITGADTPGTLERVTKAFQEISKECTGQRRMNKPTEQPLFGKSNGNLKSLIEIFRHEPPRAKQAMSLSQAYYSRSRALSLRQSIGEISSDTVLIYPPGSPVVVPGEKIDEPIVEYLSAAISCGLEVLGRGYSSHERELKVFCVES